METPDTVMAGQVRAIQFLFNNKMDRPHEVGHDALGKVTYAQRSERYSLTDCSTV
jgi:hypothetical protein